MTKIGEKRQFTFSYDTFIVKEILEDTGITMWWTWKHDICPHCKKEIINRLPHELVTVEILIPEGKEAKDSVFEDLVVLGYSKDGKLLRVTEEKIKEILQKSEKFKHLLENNNG